MKLLKMFLFLGASQGQETACPAGWTPGKDKCFKVVPGRGVKLRDAGLACKGLGGESRLFTPSNPKEIQEIKTLAQKQSFGLNWAQMYVWVGYKLENSSARKFPPQLQFFTGADAPEDMTDPGMARVWVRKTKSLLNAGLVQKNDMKFIRMNKGQFQLTSPTLKSFFGKSLCEIPKQKIVCGDSRYCYQRASLLCDEIKYDGEMDTTEMGYKCAAWNDESVWPHTYKENVFQKRMKKNWY